VYDRLRPYTESVTIDLGNLNEIPDEYKTMMKKVMDIGIIASHLYLEKNNFSLMNGLEVRRSFVYLNYILLCRKSNFKKFGIN
jgi:hypothetical protein